MLNGKIVVLQVLGGLSMGGAESRIMDILRRIDKSAFQYDFLLNEQEGFYEEEAKRLGCRIFRTDKFNVRNKGQYLKQLRDFFSAHPEIDIVQGHTTNTAGLYLPVAKECGIGCTVAHARSAGLSPGPSALLKRYYRHGLAKKADVCLACSHEAAYAVFGRAAVREGRVRILPNAVDVDMYIPTAEHIAEGERLREKLAMGEGLLFGHVGRFHYAKNHRFLLKIFAQINKQLPNAFLILVGEGELLEGMQRYAEELGIRKNVIFAGQRSDPAPFYQAMDVLVFPSHYEGLPGTVVEAQASAVPVLMSTAVTKDVRVSELVSAMPLSESASAWAREAIALAGRFPRGKRRDMLSYGDQMRGAGFDVKRQVKELEQLYSGLAQALEEK